MTDKTINNERTNAKIHCMSCRRIMATKDMPVSGMPICKDCHETCQLEAKLLTAIENILLDEGFTEEQINDALDKAADENWHLGDMAAYIAKNYIT